MIKLKQLFCFICLGIVCNINAQKKWTLKESVDYAIENNISIKQANLDLETAEIGKNDAVGNFLPTINGSTSHSWNIGLSQNATTGILENLTTQFTTGRLGANWNLFDGLRNINQLHRANLNILANRYQLEDMKDDTRLLVANAYLQIVFNRENLRVQQAQYEATKQDLGRTKELVEAGILPSGDLLEIEATAAQQEQSIVNSQNAYRLSKISLAQLLTLTDYENFDIAEEEYPVPISSILEKSPKEIYQKSLTIRNDIKVSEMNVDIAKRDLKIAKGAYWPSLGFNYNYDTRVSYQDQVMDTRLDSDNPDTVIGEVQETGQTVVSRNSNFVQIIGAHTDFFDQLWRNDGHSFGFGLSIPIFNGFATRNNVKRNKVNLERAKLRFEQEKLNLETTVNQAYNDILGAAKSFEAAKKTLKARKTAFDYSRERFNVGLLNSFDFNQSKQRVVQAEADVIRTKFTYIFNLKVLEFYFGIPIDQL